jgi:hypothetical protein
MIFLMHSHFDLKKSHFDSRNCVPDEAAPSMAEPAPSTGTNGARAVQRE